MIVKRRTVEKRVLAKLRNDFDKEIQQFSIDAENIQKEFNIWRDDFIQKKESWSEGERTILEEFKNKKNEAIEKLRQKYEEKLRFEAPVEQWRKRKISLNNQGKIWITLTSTIIILLVSLLSVFLYNLPQALKGSILSGDEGTIRAYIIFILIISLSGYLIKLFAKFAISAFHLQRDAAEREQLTYVYLALYNDNKIEEKDRIVILQSLFARADSGLLKDDSSPTMPGVENLLNK